eukprot:superscaffoldBa00001538_g11006
MCTAVSQQGILHHHANLSSYNTFLDTLYGILIPAEQRGGPESQDFGSKSGEARRDLEAKMPAVLAVGVAVLCALVAALVPGGVSEPLTLVQEPVKTESSLLKPKVMIAIVARNAAHSLPHYLGCIERLEYPKERIAIW